MPPVKSIIARSALSVRGAGKSDVRSSVRPFVRPSVRKIIVFYRKDLGGSPRATVYW